jgi:Ca2+-binding EF-hand superfamily protein
MYDLDGTGEITKENMERVVDSFYKLVGPVDESPLVTFSGKKYEAPQQVVEEFFEQMDINGDGKISLADYKEGAFKNPDIIAGLKLFALEK